MTSNDEAAVEELRKRIAHCEALWPHVGMVPFPREAVKLLFTERDALRAELAAVKGERDQIRGHLHAALDREEGFESERDALAGLLEQSRGVIRRLVGYVADDGSPGNDAALDEAECFLAQSPDRIDAALGREGEA